MTISEKPDHHQPQVTLGKLVQSLRKSQHMTGELLGTKVGLSQSKISKIEKGYPPLPDHNIIENILNILNADSTVRQQVELCYTQASESNDLRHVRYYSHYNTPHYYLNLEKNASSIKIYTQNVVPVLLQTIDYRSAGIARFITPKQSGSALIKDINLRQDLLWDEEKHYTFLLNEAALYTYFDIKSQLTQLDRLERLASSSHLAIGIIPTTKGLIVYETPNFAIYDNKKVLIAIGGSEMEIKESGNVSQYIHAFKELCNKAHFGQDAIKLIRAASDYFSGTNR